MHPPITTLEGLLLCILVHCTKYSTQLLPFTVRGDTGKSCFGSWLRFEFLLRTFFKMQNMRRQQIYTGHISAICKFHLRWVLPPRKHLSSHKRAQRSIVAAATTMLLMLMLMLLKLLAMLLLMLSVSLLELMMCLLCSLAPALTVNVD